MTAVQKMAAYASVLRFDHWVKNLFFLPGFVFAMALSGQTLTAELALRALLTFIAFGCVASVNYTINEIVDAPFDRFHPTKKFRAIPSNRVRIPILYVIGGVLLLVAFLLAKFFISDTLLFVLVTFFVSGLVYNLPPVRLKDHAIFDVVTESVNNPIRFFGGWCVVSSAIPSPLFLVTFWALGAFWMTGKRYGELVYFKSDHDGLKRYRASFAGYTERSLVVQLVASVVLFAIGYLIITFSFLPKLFFTVPWVVLYFAWYARMVVRQHPMVREPESLIKHPWFMIYNIFLAGVFYYIFFIRP